ncbi:condensin complex subunit 3 [Pelomyxa schiedti]|nr:condensin complex subunit 3 [Pelomyxa schiedti]
MSDKDRQRPTPLSEPDAGAWLCTPRRSGTATTATTSTTTSKKKGSSTKSTPSSSRSKNTSPSKGKSKSKGVTPSKVMASLSSEHDPALVERLKTLLDAVQRDGAGGAGAGGEAAGGGTGAGAGAGAGAGTGAVAASLGEMCKLQRKYGYGEVAEASWRLFSPGMVFPATSPANTALMRVFQFLVNFCNTDVGGGHKDTPLALWKNHTFAVRLIQLLLDVCGVEDKYVRFRSTQLILMLTTGIDEGVPIDSEDALTSEILLKVTPRLMDTFSSVRENAVKILTKFNNNPPTPRSDIDPITSKLMKLMRADQSPTVRLESLRGLPITKKTLPEIRELAFSIIASQVRMEELGLRHCVSLLQEGLRSSSETGNTVDGGLVKLIVHWIENFSGNPIEVLDHLDARNNIEICLNVVNTILGAFLSASLCCSTGLAPAQNETSVDTKPRLVQWTIQLSKNGPIFEFTKLTAASIIFMRGYCEARYNPMDDQAETILPSVSVLCDLIEEYTADPFVSHVLKITLTSGRCVNKFYEHLQRVVIEVITDMRDPIDQDRESQSQGQQPALDATEEAKLWTACGNVCCTLLERAPHPPTASTLPLLGSLLEDVVLPTVTHTDPTVRTLDALDSYASCGRSSPTFFSIANSPKKYAQDYLFLFLKVLENDLPTIRVHALKLKDSKHSTENGRTLDVIVSFTSSLDSEELSSVSIEGLVKLLHSDTVSCGDVFSNLVLKYFSPWLKQETIRTCLSVFFRKYAYGTPNHDKHQDVIAHSFLPTLVAVLSHNIKNPKNTIEIEKVSAFLCELTGKSGSHLPGHNESCHASMALSLFEYIASHPKYTSMVEVAFKYLFVDQADITVLSQLKSIIPQHLQVCYSAPLEAFHQSVVSAVAALEKSCTNQPRNADWQGQQDGEEFVLSHKIPLSQQSQSTGKPDTQTAALILASAKERREEGKRKRKKESMKEKQSDTETNETSVPIETPERPAPKRRRNETISAPKAPGEASTSHTQSTTKDSTPKSEKEAEATPSKVIAFSLKDRSQVEDLAQIARSFSATPLQEDNSFKPSITHVVASAGTASIQTLCASLLGGRWVISPQWLYHSKEAGHLLPEKKYGIQTTKSAISGKKIYFTEAFKADPSYSQKLFTTLIHLGKGELISEEQSADIILIPEGFGTHTPPHMTRKEFFKMIQTP